VSLLQDFFTLLAEPLLASTGIQIRERTLFKISSSFFFFQFIAMAGVTALHEIVARHADLSPIELARSLCGLPVSSNLNNPTQIALGLGCLRQAWLNKALPPDAVARALTEKNGMALLSHCEGPVADDAAFTAWITELFRLKSSADVEGFQEYLLGVTTGGVEIPKDIYGRLQDFKQVIVYT
jgi:hypothetical protein